MLSATGTLYHNETTHRFTASKFPCYRGLLLDSQEFRSMPINTFRDLTEEAGLTMKDWRTIMAFASAVLFILGVIAGFGVLASN